MSTDHLFAALLNDSTGMTVSYSGTDRVDLERIHIGQVELSTGELVICDGVYSLHTRRSLVEDGARVIRTVDPGAYDAYIFVVHYPASDPYEHPDPMVWPIEMVQSLHPGYPNRGELVSDQRIALMMIRLSEQSVLRWDVAKLRFGDEKVEEFEGEGVGIDGGRIAYMDRSIAKKLANLLASPDAPRIDGSLEIEARITQMEQRNYVSTRSWSNVPFDSVGNIVTCSSGIGSGCYPVYFGIGQRGQLCCIVTDFGILGHETETSGTEA